MKKCANNTKGIKVIIFSDIASSAGTLIEYLKINAFLQKNVTIKYRVVIGIRMGSRDEYITAIMKFKQMIAFSVGKSKTMLVIITLTSFCMTGFSLFSF